MSRRDAFVLVEVLIIVIVMAAMAAAILPQFTVADDARQSALKFNLHMVRAQIEAYKAQHHGRLPEMGKFAEQLTRATTVEGATSGGNLTCGPYFLGRIPANPFNNSHAVVAVAVPGRQPVGAVPGGAGWQYDPRTGGFWPNHEEYFADSARAGR
mgnify:CR=1 FL=1